MTDPLVRAALKAIHTFPGSTTLFPRSLAMAGARAALEPIRELHRSIDLYLWATTACDRQDHQTAEDTDSGDPICLTCTENDGGPGKFCAECFDNDGSNISWPCATARLVYTSEELS